MKEQTFKVGEKLRLAITKGLWGYKFSHKIKKNMICTVRRVKSTGGILVEEFVVGFQSDLVGGDEQGLHAYRFKKIKRSKK